MDFGGMLKKAQEMQQKMMEAKASLKNIHAEGVANNGAVKVILNGNHEMIKIDIDPKLMTEEKEVLEDLIVIATNNAKKEIELKFDLERNVRVVKFETGKIDISFNEKLSKNFVRSLTEKLKLWTGERWIISLSKETGKNTIFENKEIYKKKLLQDALESEVYKKIKENFPDAELNEVEEIK